MAFSYIVELEDKTAADAGYRRPRATLVLNPHFSAYKKTLCIPRALAKALLKEQRTSDVQFESSRQFFSFLDDAALKCASQRIAALVNRREYASFEIKKKLQADGFTTQVIEQALTQARSRGWIDDTRFASLYLRSKLNSGWGLLKIRSELKKRGIEFSESLLSSDDSAYMEDEKSRAYALACRKKLTGKNDYAKLMRFLTTRGFSYSDASYATKRILSEKEDNT